MTEINPEAESINPSERAKYWASQGQVEVTKTYASLSGASEKDLNELLMEAHKQASHKAALLAKMPGRLWSEREGRVMLVGALANPGGLKAERGAEEFLFESLNSLANYLEEERRQAELAARAHEEVAKYISTR